MPRGTRATGTIRYDSVGIVQQKVPALPGETSCKDGTNCNTDKDVLSRTGWDRLETMYKVRSTL